MSVEMAIWKMLDGGLERLPFGELERESHLEDVLVDDPSMIGLDILVVGRQVVTPYGRRIDLLGIDEHGTVHVVELKRHRTARDVVAQTLEYAAWASTLGYEDLVALWSRHHDDEGFEHAWADRFGPVPEVFNVDQQLTIVASSLDDTSERIVSHLASRYGVPINAVFFRFFTDGPNRYLARTWLLEPEQVEAASQRASSRRPPQEQWNGRDFFMLLGRAGEPHRWHIARTHGLLNAGGGTRYWGGMRRLTPGKRVFAYVPQKGYLGVGVVTGVLKPARDALVEADGRQVNLLDAPGLPADYIERARSHDDDVTEMVLPLRWLGETRDLSNGVKFEGMYWARGTVTKLADDETVRRVEQALCVPDDWEE